MRIPINFFQTFCRNLIILISIFLLDYSSFSQIPEFTKQDTLRGAITPEREWWDLTYYHLDITPNHLDSTIRGHVIIHYSILEENEIMQIDLQEPMIITAVVQLKNELKFERTGNVYYIQLQEKQIAGSQNHLTVYYEGKPKVSLHPPWDGGLAWKTDNSGQAFFATSCQGEGASLWWPCKDHMYDEPDSMKITLTVPKGLTAVANGRLINEQKNRKKKTITFTWFVSNPINNYGVNMNVADYTHFSEVYQGLKGDLDCDYYVLKENYKKAKEHFKEVPRMLEAFEYWFGPYPFYEDSYKLVEVPYPGMEHQSSVTYGNLYKNGFMGRDVSNTGWGDKFDFIIVHESGHEWFANNITYKDIADMWIHESFIAYSESLFTEYFFGKEAGFEYVRGTRANIQNNRPIIGYYDVNHAGSGDMYPKGANMLHTLRQMVNNDSIWRAMLQGLNLEFYHQTVTTEQIENYISLFTGLELTSFFNQYLRDKRLPVFEYWIQDEVIHYRWSNCIRGFDIPIIVFDEGEEIKLSPTSSWQELSLEKATSDLVVHPDYYVANIRIN